MSSQISRFSGYALAVFSAVLILHAGRATAGDTPSAEQSVSFQEAVQNVLTGNHRFHVAPGTPTAHVDTVQERIQQVLLGPSRFAITEARGRIGGLGKLTSIRAEHRPSPVDTRAAVQRMLQGDHAPEGPVS